MTNLGRMVNIVTREIHIMRAHRASYTVGVVRSVSVVPATPCKEVLPMRLSSPHRPARCVGYGVCAIALLAYPSSVRPARDRLPGRVVSRTPSPSLVVRTVHVGTRPIAVVVDEQAGRVFVVNHGPLTVGALTPRRPGTVSVLDAATGALLRTVAVGAAPGAVVVDALANRAFIATGVYGDRGVTVLDATSGAVLRIVDGTVAPLAVDGRHGRVFGAGVAPRLVNTGAPAPALVRVLDAATGVDRRTITLPQPYPTIFDDSIDALGVDERAGQVLVAHRAHGGRAEDVHGPSTINALDAVGGTMRYTITVPALASGIAVDRAAGRAIVTTLSSTGDTVSAPGPAPVYVIDEGRGRLLRTLAVAAGSNAGSARSVVMQAAVDERRGQAFVTAQDVADGPAVAAVEGGSVTILDTRTGRTVRTIAVGKGALAVAVAERAGRVFVCNADDGTVSVLNAHVAGVGMP